MKTILPPILTLVLVAGSVVAEETSTDAPATGAQAICQVCRVHEGETEPERVIATADFGGRTYGFCSKKCRDTFVESPEGYLPPVFPRPAPAFSMRDLDGTEISSEAYRGQTLLLDFWATWCPPCIDDLPELTRLHEQYSDAGFAVLSVSIDEGSDAARKVRRMIKRRNAEHPVFLDSLDSPAWGTYEVRVVPTQFLIDAEGQIVAQWSGKIDLSEVEARIEELLGEEEPVSSTR